MHDFNIRKYLLRGYLDRVGIMTDAWVRGCSSAMFASGFLTEDDLATIEAAIEEWHRKHDPSVENDEVVAEEADAE